MHPSLLAAVVKTVPPGATITHIESALAERYVLDDGPRAQTIIDHVNAKLDEGGAPAEGRIVQTFTEKDIATALPADQPRMFPDDAWIPGMSAVVGFALAPAGG